MSTEFTEQRYAELLPLLLAPEWRDRKAADTLLFSLLIWQNGEEAGPWGGEFGRAVNKLEDNFLAALIEFWCDQVISFQQNFPYIGKQNDPPASSHERPWATPASAGFPMLGAPPIKSLGMYGMGVGTMLERIGPIAVARVEQLASCLANEATNLPGTVFSALASIGPDANAVLPTLYGYVAKRGVYHYPFKEAAHVARIAAGDSEQPLYLANAIDPAGDSNVVNGFCALLKEMRPIDAEVVDRLLELASHEAPVENLRALVTTGAILAALCSHRIDDFRAHANRLSSSSKADHREIAATAFGDLGSAGDDHEMMIRLATDSDWTVRCSAHYAASLWTNPSPALVAAIVNDVGCFDGHDEEPHDAAITALLAFGAKSHRAVPQLKEWLEEDFEDLFDYEYFNHQILDLVEAWGQEAFPLRDVLARVLRRYTEGTYEEDEDLPFGDDDDDQDGDVVDNEDFAMDGEVSEEYAKEIKKLQEEMAFANKEMERLSTAESEASDYYLELAAKIGFPLHDDIPGSENDDEELEIDERLAKIVASLGG